MSEPELVEVMCFDDPDEGQSVHLVVRGFGSLAEAEDWARNFADNGGQVLVPETGEGTALQ